MDSADPEPGGPGQQHGRLQRLLASAVTSARAPFTTAHLQGLWRRKRPMVLQAVAIGVAVHLLLLLLLPTGLSRRIEDWAADWMIYGAGFQPPRSSDELDPAFLFIDIDDATLEVWPPVPYTPRDKLLQLLRFGVENGAAAVLLDVNITRTIGRERTSLSPEDAALVDQLRRWPPSPTVSLDCSRPLIVFNREFRKDQGQCRPVRRSFLDDALRGIPSPIAWGSVEFVVDADQQVRNWRLEEKACGDGVATVMETIPSVQTLVWKHLECRKRAERGVPAPPQGPTLAGRAHDELGDRIVYGIQWKPAPGTRGQRGPTVLLNGREVPALTVLPAKAITEARSEVSGHLAKDRVVVIGGSAEDARDIVATPAGDMPGAIVLVNSIYSLARYGRLQPASWAAESALALTCVLVGSILLALVHGAVGYALLAAGTAALFVPLSLWALRGGHWINWVVPLLAVAGHNLGERAKEALDRWRPRGH